MAAPDRHPLRWVRCPCGLITCAVWSVARAQYVLGLHQHYPADRTRHTPGTRCALSYTAVEGETYASVDHVPTP